MKFFAVAGDKVIEAGEERPRADVSAGGINGPGFLDLVLLLQRVDAVFALNVGSTAPVTDGVNSGGDF